MGNGETGLGLLFPKKMGNHDFWELRFQSFQWEILILFPGNWDLDHTRLLFLTGY